MSYVVLHDASFIYYLIDLIVALGVLAGLRYFSGAVANVSLTEVLSVQDNFAMGISLAGAVTGVAIMLMGAVAGDAGGSPGAEVLLMLCYGVVGIALMWLTRRLFDRLSLPEISVHGQILAGNVAAGIVDAGNLIATAIVVRAVMSWVDGSSFFSILVVLIGYGISQGILYLATLYRSRVFDRNRPGESLQKEIEAGNVALAVRFSGHRIGVGLAVTAASGISVYHPDAVIVSLLVWSFMAAGTFVGLTLITIFARFVLLPGIDVAAEVIDQKNVAIGTLEASVFIAVGLLFVGLFG